MSDTLSVRADTFQRRFLLALVAAVSLLFLWMVREFLLTLLVAALAAGLAFPLHERLRRLLRDRPMAAAGLVVAATLLLVVGPFTAFLGVVVAQAVEITQAVGPWVEERVREPGSLADWLRNVPLLGRLPLETFLPEHDRLVAAAGEAVRGAGQVLIDGAAATARLTGLFLLKLFIFLYAMFFFLLRGRELLDAILYRMPLEPGDEALVVERFLSVTRATLKGSLVIGALQGLLAGAAFAVAGVQGAAFWGTVMAVLSVIPGLGAPVVWVPAVAWLFATGETAAAVGLAAWCAVLVGSVDNVLRPRLVGSDARMSDLMILLATLGGISLFGAVGFVVGPIVAAVFVTLWDVYARAFADVLPGQP